MTAGYQAPRYPEVRVDVQEKWKRTWGDNANVAPDQLDGLLIDMWAIYLAIIYEALSEHNAQHYYTTSEGGNLDAILALFGFKRRDESNSSVEILVYGDDGTTVAEDSTISTLDTGDTFVVDDDIDISVGSIWAVFLFDEAVAPVDIEIIIDGNDTEVTFAFGGSADFLRDGMAAAISVTPEVAQVITAGEQPDGKAILLVQMQAGFAYSITSTASTVSDHIGATGTATAEATGKISAALGTLVTINTPEPGWIGVSNRSDAILGAPRQNDTQARAFHELTLNNAARATPRGVVDELYELDDVNRVRWFENLTGTPDLLGRPSHSWEIVIDGGDPVEIAELIWLNHTTGTQSWGLELYIVQDTRGHIPVDRKIRFTRPTSQYIHIRVTVVKGERFPNLEIFDLKRATKEAIVAWGNSEIDMGDDVYIPDLVTQVGKVLEGSKSTVIEIGTTPGPADATPGLSPTNIIIGDRNWAKFQDTRIEVLIG